MILRNSYLDSQPFHCQCLTLLRYCITPVIIDSGYIRLWISLGSFFFHRLFFTPSPLQLHQTLYVTNSSLYLYMILRLFVILY
jgi:hypothetical protein